MADYAVEMKGADTGLTLDVGDEVFSGGGGTVTPFTLLLHSIGSCSTFVYRNLLERNGIANTYVNTRVTGASVDRKAQDIKVVITIEVAEEDREKAQRFVAQIGNFCTIVRSLDPAIHVEESVVFI